MSLQAVFPPSAWGTKFLEAGVEPLIGCCLSILCTITEEGTAGSGGTCVVRLDDVAMLFAVSRIVCATALGS
jgi:hypothetical protein